MLHKASRIAFFIGEESSRNIPFILKGTAISSANLNARSCFKLVSRKPLGFNKKDMINLYKFIEVCAKIYRLKIIKKWDKLMMLK